MEKIKIPSLVVFGGSGAGKSTLLNKIAGDEKLFKVGHRLISETDDFEQKKCTLFNKHQVTLWDTIGFKDNKKPSTEIFEKLAKFYHGIHDIFMILFTIPVYETRLDVKSFLMAIDIFGMESLDYFYIVFTQKDLCNNEKSIIKMKEDVQKEFKKAWGLDFPQENFFSDFEVLHAEIERKLEINPIVMFDPRISQEIRNIKGKKIKLFFIIPWGEETFLDSLEEVSKKNEHKGLNRILSHFYGVLSTISNFLKKQNPITEENYKFLKNFEILERKFHHLNDFFIHEKNVDDHYYCSFTDNNDDQTVQKIDQNPHPENNSQIIEAKVEEKSVEDEAKGEQPNSEKNEQSNNEENEPPYLDNDYKYTNF